MAHSPRVGMVRAFVALCFVAAGVISACGGGEFSEDTAGSGGSAGSDAGVSGQSQAGGGGTPPSTGGDVVCHGPDECDDLDPCTVDECDGEGFCRHSAKCLADGLLCCDGVCSQCCAKSDCDDALGCTGDQCFNGFCAHVPDDSACGMNQYCSLADDCKDREPCPNGTAQECDDGDPCTTDTCDNAFCSHDFCAVGKQCCPDKGCATCCSDSQCADDDACTDNVCSSEGTCSSSAHCESGQCCESPDGTSATCGSCCSADECQDQFDCTIDSCTVDGCTHSPDSSKCGSTQICDPQQGCIALQQCTGDADCTATDPCSMCDNGKCTIACGRNGTGALCCPGLGCRGCCDYTDCDSGQLCCDGLCQTGDCCTAADCLLKATNIIPIGCQHSTCDKGACNTVYEDCGDFQICCAPDGCALECNLTY